MNFDSSFRFSSRLTARDFFGKGTYPQLSTSDGVVSLDLMIKEDRQITGTIAYRKILRQIDDLAE